MRHLKKINRYNEVIPVLVWTFIFVLPFLLRIILFQNDPRNGSLLSIFLSFLTIIALFYIHTYFIYPLIKKRYGKWIYSVLLLTCLLAFYYSMSFLMRDMTGIAKDHGIFGGDGFNPARLALAFPFILVIFCSYTYRLYIDKIRQNERMKEMETNHLKTELDFLRSQVSPHFMFNLMNTLVSMARKKSDLMEPSLISLSRLMRYMLYESSGNKISLASEIEYLQSYIDLQLLRFGDMVRFNLFISGNPDGHTIEPMLLIPFVENAFKHGVSNIPEPIIEATIAIDHQTHVLHFSVTNNVNEESLEKDRASGIGLVNVVRRLDLLYPGKHILSINEKTGLFQVNLKIDL